MIVSGVIDAGRRGLPHLAVMLLLGTPLASVAFQLSSTPWADGEAQFSVNFAISNPERDGKFQTAFEEALQIWTNTSTFTYTVDNTSSADPCAANAGNGASFEDSDCGSAYGANTLAVQTAFFVNGERTRSVITFNNAINWDVYAGPRINGTEDFRRVAVHELGHSLGLNHEPVNTAIMEPFVSNIETPTADDLAGVSALYDSDGDGVGLATDNCPHQANAGQDNLDNDQFGDACDADIDNDGVYNSNGLDQSFASDNLASGFFPVGNLETSEQLAQTFSAGISGSLVAVQAPVYCPQINSQPSSLNIEIRTVDGNGNPTPTVLDQAVFADGLTTSFVGMLEIDLTADGGSAALVAGDNYAIVIGSNRGCRWTVSNGGAYSGGEGRFTNNKVNWFNLGEDLPFASVMAPAEIDNCPTVPNPDQADVDMNDVGDVCENVDDDDDGVLNFMDNCPNQANADQADLDNDETGDVCDDDIDGDAALNDNDSNDFEPLVCSDTDVDGCDDCSSGIFNLSGDGPDNDSDGACDIGDLDDDNDLVDDGDDNCPLIANADQLNFDNDGFGDVCDADIDNDGAPNGMDSNDMDVMICSDNDNDLCEDCSSGMLALMNDGPDNDSDGLCDIGDADDDNDQVADGVDNCPLDSNPGQSNLDNDAFGDACDLDADGDTVEGERGSGEDENDLNRFVCFDSDFDGCDDCASGQPDAQNDGRDTDSNGICNIGDDDDDGDGVDDLVPDNCPLIPNPDQLDSDNNGIGDVCDGTDQLCVPLTLSNNKFVLICL